MSKERTTPLSHNVNKRWPKMFSRPQTSGFACAGIESRTLPRAGPGPGNLVPWAMVLFIPFLRNSGSHTWVLLKWLLKPLWAWTFGSLWTILRFWWNINNLIKIYTPLYNVLKGLLIKENTYFRWCLTRKVKNVWPFTIPILTLSR